MEGVDLKVGIERTGSDPMPQAFNKIEQNGESILVDGTITDDPTAGMNDTSVAQANIMTEAGQTFLEQDNDEPINLDTMDVEQAGQDEGLIDGLLISYAGKDAIKEAWERYVVTGGTVEHAKEFIRSFREKHRLQHESIDEVVNLLEAAGVPRSQLARDIMNNLVHLFKQKIRNLSQTQLQLLLDSCYSYLTVQELSHIAIATLEHLKYVEPSVWSQIVNNGLEESPYTDLPLALKHRIWVQETSAFDYEIEVILSRVLEVPMPTYSELESNPLPEKRKEKNSVLMDFLSLTHGLTDELLATAAERLYHKACAEQNPARRIALANIFHDFMIQTSSRSTATPLAVVRKLARILSASTSSPRISTSDLQLIYESVTRIESRSYVAFLLSSSISRDFIADQLVVHLFDCRGPIGDGDDEKLILEAKRHLRNQSSVIQLTCLMMYNVKGTSVLSDGDIVLPEEVDAPFQQFYPIVIGEMHTDASVKQNGFYASNSLLPSTKLMQMVTQGKLERRVISTYCLFLASHQDHVGLFRFRLLLDAIIATCDPKDEAREHVIANALLRRLTEM